MITIYSSIALIAIISLYKTPDNKYFFSLERSKILKAFLPIFIILHHIALQIHIPFFSEDFSRAGSVIVGIFFFISGYGLQYKKNQNTLFIFDLNKRLKKLVIPIIIPAILYWSIYLYINNDNKLWSLNYIWNHNYFILPYSWFIPILIIINFLYYIEAHFIKHYFILTFGLSLYILFYVMRHYNMPIWMFQNLFCFLLGMIYLKYEHIKKKIKCHHIFLIGILLLYISYLYNNKSWIDCQSLIGTSGIIILYSICNLPIRSRLINFFNSISYEMYLCHGISFLILSSISLDHITYIILSISLTIIIAYIANYSTKTLLKKIQT